MTSKLYEQREEFQAALTKTKELLAFNEENKVRYFRREGSGPEVNITEEINDEHRKLIDNYNLLIKTIDQMIAGNQASL